MNVPDTKSADRTLHVIDNAPADITDDALSEITMLLNLRRGINMSMYKDNYTKRRIAIRMRAARSVDVSSYCHLLRSSDDELDLLAKGITIHVSHFFRNPSVFETLRRDILPSAFNALHSATDTSFNILCLGSACGEEPYSLAILLKEHFGREIRQFSFGITALDIDNASIVQAQQGEYSEDRLRELPHELRKHYFREDGGRFRLIPIIKEMVTFQQADITDPAAYRSAKLVFCRNTLIYFVRPDQEKILHAIAEILPCGGILVLGKSEALVGTARRLFETISMEERIYRKK